MAEQTNNTKAEEVPKKLAPPTVAGTPEANQTALLGKVTDYLGPEAMADKVQKLEFGQDFLAAVPQQHGLVAAQLLHRLNFETLPEGEYENWAKIPVEQRHHMFALMSRFIDNRVATDGMRHADKPVFRKKMKYPELTDFLHRNDAEGLQNQLAAGQTVTLDENDIEPGGPLDTWLYKNGFIAHAVAGTNKTVIGPSEKVKSSYAQLQERYEKVLAYEKKEIGRPLRHEYVPRENHSDYRKEIEALPAHPAEDEEIQKAFLEIVRRLPSDETGELTSACLNRYQRQLRRWTQRMLNVGRQDDLRLIGQKTELEMKLTRLRPYTGDYEATEKALQLLNGDIKRTNADRPVFDAKDGKDHKHPEILTVIFDVDLDYKDWKKRFEAKYGKKVSLQEPIKKEEKTTMEEILGEYEHEPTFEGKVTGRAVTGEDEDRVHNDLDIDHEAKAAEFSKQLRTKREKAYLYYIANQLNAIYGRHEVKAPEGFPKLPNHKSEKLSIRITDEYIRFLEKGLRTPDQPVALI